MDYNKILSIATTAGKILLENGAETYRVEETIVRVCESFGASSSDSFVTPGGIIASITDENGKVHSLVQRIHSRTVNMHKIHAVNDLARSITLNQYDLADVDKILKDINSSPTFSDIVIVIASAFAAGTFTLLIGGTLLDFLCSFAIGLLLKKFIIMCQNLCINTFFTNSIGGAIASLLALILTQLSIANSSDKIAIGSIMLLVPGLAITNAIRDTIAGDFLSGLIRAAEAFLIAVSIAAGSGLVFSLWIDIIGGL